MSNSSLLGIDRAARIPAGRDTATLGPGDSSDSGSDMMGLDGEVGGDPGVPVDVALRDDVSHPAVAVDALDGRPSDAGGSVERRSAGGDAGREAADIGVDRVFSVADEESPADDPAELAVNAGGDSGVDGREAEDTDLGFVDDAQIDDLLEDEPESRLEADQAMPNAVPSLRSPVRK